MSTTDVSTLWDVQNGRGDWAISGADLQSGNDLITALFISIFTDRSALASDVIPDGSNDRRGWLGDLGEDVPIGSRLWLLDRAKQTPDTLARAKEYIAEALQWMIDDGVAGSIDLYVEWTKPGMLGCKVTLYQPGKKAPTFLEFNWAWQPAAVAAQVYVTAPAPAVGTSLDHSQASNSGFLLGAMG